LKEDDLPIGKTRWYWYVLYNNRTSQLHNV